MARKSTVDFDESDLILWGGIGLVLFIWWNGGIKEAAAAAGGALVDAAGGVITGADTAIGINTDFPPGFAGTSDPKIARWILDDPRGGYSSFIYRTTPRAQILALRMDAGTGTPPAPGSPLAQIFPPYVDMPTEHDDTPPVDPWEYTFPI